MFVLVLNGFFQEIESKLIDKDELRFIRFHNVITCMFEVQLVTEGS